MLTTSLVTFTFGLFAVAQAQTTTKTIRELITDLATGQDETKSLKTMNQFLIDNPSAASVLGESNIIALIPSDLAFKEEKGRAGPTVNSPNMTTFLYQIVPSDKDLGSYEKYTTLVTKYKEANLGDDKNQVLSTFAESTDIKISDGTYSIKTEKYAAKNGGYLYVIDRVLTVPKSVTERLEALGLSEFMAIVKKVKMETTLNALKGVTIFAPCDYYITKHDLTKYTDDKLKELINYHIIPKVSYRKQLVTENAKTMNAKEPVKVVVDGESVKVNDATISKFNQFTNNGVIHTLDGLLIPSSASARISGVVLATLVAAVCIFGI